MFHANTCVGLCHLRWGRGLELDEVLSCPCIDVVQYAISYFLSKLVDLVPQKLKSLQKYNVGCFLNCYGFALNGLGRVTKAVLRLYSDLTGWFSMCRKYCSFSG